MSQDGQYLYIPSNGYVSIVKTSNDSEYKKIVLGKNERIMDLISGDKTMIYVVSCQNGNGLSGDCKFRAVDIEKGVVKTIELASSDLAVFRLLHNALDKYVYILGNGKSVKYDTDTKSLVDEKPFVYLSTPSDISPNSKFIFAPSSKDKIVVVYDIEKQAVVKNIPFEKNIYDIIAK